MKDIHEYVLQVSCNQSGEEGGDKSKSHFCSHGGEGGSGEGLNLLMQYLNSLYVNIVFFFGSRLRLKTEVWAQATISPIIL